MKSCEAFQDIFEDSITFNLKISCHNVIRSYFKNIVSPILIDDLKSTHNLKIEENSFVHIFNQTISFYSTSGSIIISKTSLCSGQGFLNRYDSSHGMAAQAQCSDFSTVMTSFSGFNRYGKISYAVYNSNIEAKNFNESSNHLTDYISFFLQDCVPVVSYFTLANSTGASNGIEFNSGVSRQQYLKNSNFIHDVVFMLPDLSGNDPGLIVSTRSGTNLVVDNVCFAGCRSAYFVQREGAPAASLSNIHSDDAIGTQNSLFFDGTIDIGHDIATCKGSICNISLGKKTNFSFHILTYEILFTFDVP